MVALPLFLPVRALGAEPRGRARVPPKDPTRTLSTLPLDWTKAAFEKATNTSCISAFQRFQGFIQCGGMGRSVLATPTGSVWAFCGCFLPWTGITELCVTPLARTKPQRLP